MKIQGFFRQVIFLAMVLTTTTVFGQSVDSVCFNTAPAAFSSDSAASGADGVFTYQWQDSTASGSWNPASGTNDGLVYQPAALTQTTFYRRQVTSASCGIAHSNVLTVHVFDLLDTVSTAFSNVSCNGGSDGSITVNVTGGNAPYTYSWSDAGSTTGTNSGLDAGTYTVSVSDAALCDTLIHTFTITEPVQLVASSILDSAVTCNGLSDGGATASATGGTMNYTYNWSNNATTASITGVAAGTYSVTITDANGCTDSTAIVVTEPAVLVAASMLDSNVSCNGLLNGGATASAMGGNMNYTYNWSNSATTASITGLAAGTYSVTITDAKGCTDSTSLTISQPALLVAASIVDSNVTCNSFMNGGASASATGGTMNYSYNWNNAATTASITGVAAGAYLVTITDANGCTDSTSVVITEPAPLVAATILDSAVTCNGLSDGGATASATGGTMNYSYNWSNNATNVSITGVASGTYSVTITDANGCTDSTTIAITQPDSLLLSTVPTNVTCNGGTDGSVTLTVVGGTAGYTYLWSDSSTDPNLSAVGANNYMVTVTDSNGCVETTSDVVNQPAILSGGSISTN